MGKNKEVDSFSAEALSSEEDINVHQPRLTAASIHRRKLLKVLTDKEKAASNQKINKKDSKNNKRASCGSDDDIGSTGNLQSGNMNVTGSSVAGDLFGKHQRRSFKHRRTQEDDEDEDMPLQTSSKPVHTKSLSNASESSDSAADFCRRGNSEGDHSRKTDVNPGDSIEAASTISAETKRIDKKQTVTWDMHSENGSEGRMEVQIIPAVSAPANTTRVGDEGIKSVREQTGFNDLGLCRHCRAVAKLPTCSNVLHKNGVRWVGAGLREPAALTKVLLSAPSSGHGAKALPIKPTPAIGLSDNLATAPLKQAVREVKQPSNVTPNLSSDAALSKPVGANVSAATLKFAALAANSAHHPLMSNFGSILPEKTSFSVSQFNLTLAKSSAEFMISKKQTVSDLRTGLDSTISEHSFTKTESADRDASTSDSPSTSVKMRFGLRAGDDKNGKASITSMFSPPSVAGTDQVYRSRLSGESYSEERGNAKQGDDYNYISTRMDVGRNFNTYRRDRAWEEDDRDRWGRSIRGTDSLPRDRPTEGHERNERERNEDRRAHLAREQRRSLSRERETANRERRRDGQDRSKSPEYYKRRDRARSKSRSRSRSRSRYRSTSRSWTRGRDRRERRGREEDSSDDRTYGAKVSNSASLISRETPSIYKKLCNYCRGLAKLNGCRVIGHVDGDYFSSSRQAESGLCSYCHSLKKLFRCRFPHHKDGFGV
ncbi:hypothetical protein EON65_14520 [archaeon]|nr:MAG: hypothetical protein EON65_14520 [archaeon]